MIAMNSAAKRPTGGECRKVRLRHAVVLVRLVEEKCWKAKMSSLCKHFVLYVSVPGYQFNKILWFYFVINVEHPKCTFERLFMCAFFVLTDDSGPSERKKSKICCSYGENCYRRNPAHFKEYLHPHCELKLRS
jgi:Zinc-finger (CX5CX6HX5H) motif.